MNFTEYYSLYDTIKSATKNREFIYVANPGNLGDAAIRVGALKFFNQLGLKYKEIPRHKIFYLVSRLTHDTIVFGGGGAFCGHYDRSGAIFKAARLFKNVIILPSTYGNEYSFPPNVISFRRDQKESATNCEGSRFCHDMAFFIGKLECNSGNGIGSFFRTDNEGSLENLKYKEGNNDISAAGDEYGPVSRMIDSITKFKKIETDRLHVAILSGLCGKEVDFYEGNYFKNRAVYNATMLHSFPNVRLMKVS